MRQYLDLLRHVRDNGLRKADRTGTGTLSLFGHQMRFDLAEGFPLLTTKKLHIRSIVHELLWFLNGETNIGYLKDHKVRIWDEWATPEGDLGPVYGRQWRAWPAADGRTIDQVGEAVETIRNRPDSRRIIVVAWNPAELPDESVSPQENVYAGRMALAPCHCLVQFWVGDGKLSCQLYQRSCDVFLGVPFNIASYALLTHMMAQQCDLGVGDFVWTGGDVHLYLNHLEQADLQLTRTPKPLPKLLIRRRPPSRPRSVYHGGVNASPPQITLVVAVADNGVIGADGGMPWHLPADLAHFKQVTMGKPVLMGRLTWESIGRPLPGRLNLVLTSNPSWRAEGATRVGSLDDALEVAAAHGARELMVIGGAHVYEDALPRARRIHLTKVHCEPWGDTLFPELDPQDWREIARQERQSDGKNPYDLTFVGLERVR